MKHYTTNRDILDVMISEKEYVHSCHMIKDWNEDINFDGVTIDSNIENFNYNWQQTYAHRILVGGH